VAWISGVRQLVGTTCVVVGETIISFVDDQRQLSARGWIRIERWAEGSSGRIAHIADTV